MPVQLIIALDSTAINDIEGNGTQDPLHYLTLH